MSKLYTYWCISSAAMLFLVSFPFQFAFLQFKPTHFLADRLNHFNIKIMVVLWGLKVDIEGKQHLDKKQNYVLVANHASYLDIPMMFLVNRAYGKFVGKSSLRSIPLFGYMYRKLYIMVNRRDAKSRKRVFELSKKALEEKRNIIIFPEGTIPMKGVPKMLPFKDGAFKVAIETQTPIVPVTILNNWKILNLEKPLRIKNHNFAAIVHEPISTVDYTIENIAELRSKVYNIIDEQITKEQNNEN